MTMQKIDSGDDDRTVRFAEHLAFSPSFQPLFNDGMALVDETAIYLDGPGRVDAKSLPRQAATLYAAESMRLTTRLMQIASWLLLQRAANQGDMSREQVETEKTKVRLDGIGSGQGSPYFDDLPDAFRALVDKVLKLERRIAMLDKEIYGTGAKGPVDDSPNPVAEQLSLLRTAFRS